MENKTIISKLGFINALVPLLQFYSSEENFDEKNVNLVLKAMANFSLVVDGIEVLLEKDIIKIFKKYFESQIHQHLT